LNSEIHVVPTPCGLIDAGHFIAIKHHIGLFGNMIAGLVAFDRGLRKGS